jgi:hypothetical protein
MEVSALRVYLLLLPLAASIVAAARYVVGVRGLGVFIPLVVAVIFLMLGIGPGLVTFLLILAVATLSRLILRRLKIHYLARMSLILWFVTLAVLFFDATNFTLAVFPILILILLAENFVEVQITQSATRAIRLTVETLLLSVGCFALFNWAWLQKIALAQPEIFLGATLVLNLLIGRFAGMRLLEYHRFRRLLK